MSEHDFQERYLTARRAVIERDLRHLNPMQRKAAMTIDGPLLLLAGAGSGKTTVLIQRVYNLLTYGRGSDSRCKEIPDQVTESDLEYLENFLSLLSQSKSQNNLKIPNDIVRLCAIDIPKPWEILTITFTNKAAEELKTRLSKRLGSSTAHDVWASTFHSACVRILRRDIDRLGFRQDFTIYDTDDSKRILKDIIKELNLDDKLFSPKSVLNIISNAKDRYENPDAFAANYSKEGNQDWRMTRVAKIYQKYQEALRSANALDFDDIIFYTVKLLQQEPEILAYYQNKFRYILVDEYQDTNHLQYLLTSLLAGDRKNLCVVGDDDQSIYRFRGANVENILNFEQQYSNARVIYLEQNYRSSQNILDAANAVIRNNHGRKPKTLWTSQQGGEMVTVQRTFNEHDEAESIAHEAIKYIQAGKHFHDIVVLYRMNAQSNALEYAMKRNGVPYKIVGGMKFFDRAEVKDLLAYLSVLNNPLDDLRLRRIINSPPRGIGQSTLNKLSALAIEQGASLYEICRNADLFPVLKSAETKLLNFANLIDNLRRSGQELSLPEFYDAVCKESGYLEALEKKNDLENRGRIENVLELRSNIFGFLEREPEDATLSGFLNEIALYTDLDELEENQDCITMMTIHSAKGLEFPIVYVVGMEEGIFPTASALYDPEDIEEERRLCYVAMTRAKERLILTHCHQRMLYGHTSNNWVSRFLEELPKKNIRWLGLEDQNSNQNQPVFASRFRSTRNNDYSYMTTQASQKPIARSAPKSKSKPSSTQNISSERTTTAKSILTFQTGDQIKHDAFGLGRVLDIKKISNDFLVVVQFEKDEKPKRFLMKYAGKFIQKVEN